MKKQKIVSFIFYPRKEEDDIHIICLLEGSNRANQQVMSLERLNII